MKAVTSKRNKKRQPNSMKIWVDETTDMLWASVRVHHGRVTDIYRGPHSKTVEGAVEALNDHLKLGV
jgi:hypothetical protein